MGRMRGKEHSEFSAILGKKALQESVDLYGQGHPFTALRPCLRGEDPDDSFSRVPYGTVPIIHFQRSTFELALITMLIDQLTDIAIFFDAFCREIEKGFNLLYYLEKHLGGAEVFEPYLRAHVQEFAGCSINTDDWKAFLYSFMEKNFGQEKVDLLNKVDWEAWLAGTGMVNIFSLSFTSSLVICPPANENA